MRQYEESETVSIKRICGHTDTLVIRKYKREINRERRISNLREHLCWACFVSKTRRDYDLVPLRLSYCEYKRSYRGCLADGKSYNKETKMITVYVRKEHKLYNEMLEFLISECGGTTEKQAIYLLELSKAERHKIAEWFAITEDNESYRKALRLLYDNDPCYHHTNTYYPFEPEETKNEEAGEENDAMIGGRQNVYYDNEFPF